MHDMMLNDRRLKVGKINILVSNIPPPVATVNNSCSQMYSSSLCMSSSSDSFLSSDDAASEVFDDSVDDVTYEPKSDEETVQNKRNMVAVIEPDLRGKHEKHRTLDPAIHKGIRKHMESIPKIESHYTRAYTTRPFMQKSLFTLRTYHIRLVNTSGIECIDSVTKYEGRRYQKSKSLAMPQEKTL
ncbi:hypothetical protein ANN_17614 [Periplaneta americana]|uniref:Uncharacterized protein n=1 Tax=Periplaneta americana TaxID=6978 RepID=A0ABQ8STF2_PERAM|nr:hypothetical protein ANN_17614 [Periplaneta americana]